MQTPTTPRGRRHSAERALALWRQYHATGDRRLRDQLVTMHLPLVRFIVYKKIRELPAHYEVDDLVSGGVVAMIQALDRYDPAKGATLEQFLWTRVHGAVIDELRRDDPATRRLRRWERAAGAARARFVGEHGREPSVQELAVALDVTPQEVRARQCHLIACQTESLNTIVEASDDAIERLDTLVADEPGAEPETALASAEAREHFRAAFRTLSARERDVAALIYAGDVTLKEIGARLGVSESRVCQIHGELKKRLGSALSEQRSLFVELDSV